MSRFNTAAVGTKTTNLAQGPAYQESPELELVSILLTSFVQDKFYRSADAELNRLKELIQALIGQGKEKFLAQAAIYARRTFGMRSITHVLAAEIAHAVKGKDWLKSFFQKIVYRPDDMLEILAYYLNTFGKRPIPNALKRGFAKVLEGLDEYRMSKYQKSRSMVKMVDVVNLVHPKSTPVLSALMKGTLATAETWETKLTQAGTKAEGAEHKEELKKEVWRDLVLNKKLGYLALLRNIRNILTSDVSLIDPVCEALTDEEVIKKSLILPFQYITALDALKEAFTPIPIELIRAINKAVDTACNNVPKFPGQTLVCLDMSGSMQGQCFRIGSLFAAVLAKSNNAHVVLFSDDAEFVPLNPDDSTLTLCYQMDQRFRGGGTNFDAPFHLLKRAYDRIIILSDMQAWMETHTPVGAFNQYKHCYDASPKVYSWDLQGYGTLQFPQRDVFCLAGFSDKVFDVMSLLESDRSALVNTIQETET